jgi:hypothetical protein
MRFVRQLADDESRLRDRVRHLEETTQELREQSLEDRQLHVSWLATALKEATDRLQDPSRKRRRDH